MRLFNTPTWSTWTSLLFLLPGITAVVASETTLAYLMFAVALCSLAYHYHKRPGPDWWSDSGRKLLQSFLLWLDTVLGLLAAVAVFAKAFPIALVCLPVSVAMLVVVFVGLYSFFVTNRHYERWHGIWHVVAASFVVFVTLS